MNGKQLINNLLELKDNSKQVVYFINGDWVEVPIDTVLELDDRIILGFDLPPEKYEDDYKYERS